MGCQFGRSGSSGFAGNFRVNGVAFYGNTAVVVAFAVFIETVHFRPSQCVGNDGMVFAVGETAQFFAVASVNGGQITVAKIDFGKQQPCAAVGGGDLVEVV